MADATRIAVTGESPYEVVVGRGLSPLLPEALGERVRRAALLHPAARRATAEELAERARAAGIEPLLLELPDAEAAKTADVAARCWAEPRRA